MVEDYRQLAQADGGRVFAADPAASRVRIYAFRGGAAAASGHNHVLAAPKLVAYAYLPVDPSNARFDLQLRLDQLLVDDPEARREAGPAFSATLDDQAVAGTREHMLSAANLDAARFPYLVIHARRVVGEGPRLIASVAIGLHGQVREILVPLRIEQQGNDLQVSGDFAVRQTDFGIVPYSVLGGLLGVRDELAIEFTIRGSTAKFDAGR